MIKLISVFFTAILASSIAFASGSGDYGSSGGYGNTSGSTYQPKKVDENYEYGKSLFKNTVQGSEKIKYCLVSEGEPVKIKSKAIKTFKGKTSTALANAIVNCKDTNKTLSSYLKDNESAYVLYYLNKRYKLKLDS